MQKIQELSARPVDEPVSRTTFSNAVPKNLLAIILTFAVVALHFINLVHVNALWRDEANSVVIATLPKFSQIWSALEYDSFPLLHFLVIRLWTFIAGSGDSSLRIFGLLTGLLIIVAFWHKSLKLSRQQPVILLLLIGFNPIMIRFLDGIRPNGIGALATIFSFTAVGLMLETPSTKRILLATIALTLCTQALFQNALLVLAIGIAAISTALIRYGLRKAVLLTIPFAAAALSLLPYIGNLQKASAWSPVAMTTKEHKLLLRGLLDLIDQPEPWGWLVWLAVLIAALYGIRIGLMSSKPAGMIRDQKFYLTLYAGLTMIGTVVIFMLFFAFGVNISPKSWHYIPMATLFAVTADTLVAALLEQYMSKIAITAIAGAVAVGSLYPAFYAVQQRSSSMDIVAASIAMEAWSDDIVVLMPWFYAVSFNRYYHGRAPWISFPSLNDNSIHRFDLLKVKMQQPERVRNDLEMIIGILKNGGRVWIVGSAYAREPGRDIPMLPPPPLPVTGWSSDPYRRVWGDALMTALATHAQTSRQLFVNRNDRFTPMEAPVMAIFQGYKD